MERPDNRRITEHFWLYEFLFGSELPKLGHELNIKSIDEFDDFDVEGLAEDLEALRSEVNFIFKEKNGGKTIGLEITSGFRCLAWEIYRKRSGQSRHRWDAVDFRPTNVSKELSQEIIWWLHKRYSPRIGGWEGGFAIAEPDLEKGKTGFVHIDRRDKIARWTY